MGQQLSQKSAPRSGKSGDADAALSPGELADFGALTCFSEDDILQWYRSFCSHYPEGRMSAEDVEKLYMALFPFGTAQRFREHVFRMIDVDHDGQVDFREFLTCLAVVLNGNPEQKLKRAFCLYDVDGDGYITGKELAAIFEQMQLTGRMVLSNPQHSVCANNLIAKFDANGDGRLDFDEFAKLARTIPPVVDTIYREVDMTRDSNSEK